MALDLGELVGFLEVDDTRWNKGLDTALRSVDEFGDKAKPRALAAGRKAGDAFGDGLVPEAEQAGEDAGEAAGSSLAATGAVAAGAAGVIFGVAFSEALDIDAGTDKLAAQLGATVKESRQYGRIAGNLYSGAWGDSMDEVRNAIGAVSTSIDGLETVGGKRLQALTGRALDFATAFEIDVVRAAQVAGTMIESKLARNGIRAFDLLTKGAQKVPAALREDLLDAVEEYGQFFASLGYDGPQAFALLVDASAKGVYGIDKAGDAIKEFTIRSTDGSLLTEGAYNTIGLNMETMSNKILRGGDDAQEATQKIIDGLLGIEDPTARAMNAIALFGTPVEDLNVKDIPAFLRSLKGTSDAMDGVEGSSKKMADTLNDNASTKITAFKRKLETQFVGYFVDEVIPVLEDDVIPLVERFGDWLSGEGGDDLKAFAGDLKPVVGAVKDLAGFLNDLPGEAKLAALAAVLAGGTAIKLRGGGNGLTGSIGTALGLAKPVPVIVMNPGFGAGLPGTPGKPGAPTGKTGGLPKWLGTLAGLPLPALGALGADQIPGPKMPANPDSLPMDVRVDKETGEVMGTASGDAAAAAAKWQGMLDGSATGGGKTSPDLQRLADGLETTGKKAWGAAKLVDGFTGEVKGGRVESNRLRDSLERLGLADPVMPRVNTSSIERALTMMSALNAGMHGVPTAGVDGSVPFLSGGVPDANPRGVNFNGPITVKANSPYELSQQLDKKTRTKSRGGRG